MQATDYAAIQAARAFAAQQLHATHQHLTPAGTDSLGAAAKNIRTELKAAFPLVKFSVRSSRFSMGDAINVKWTDGPTSQQVESIINKYTAGNFDGMTDCYNYEPNAWTDAFGDAKYIHANRDHSPRAIAAAIRTVWTRYAGNLEGMELATVEQFERGALWNVQVPHLRHELQSLINIELSRRTWAIATRREGGK
jgi:hypothetical protein